MHSDRWKARIGRQYGALPARRIVTDARDKGRHTKSPIPGYIPGLANVTVTFAGTKIPPIAETLAAMAGHPGVHSLGSHHHKILIVYGDEGLIGFCGGVDLDKNRLGYLHDVHLRVLGGSAKELLKIAE